MASPVAAVSVCSAKVVVALGHPEGHSRTLSAEKEALMVKALQERLSQRAIARTPSVSRDTVREVLKKSPIKRA